MMKIPAGVDAVAFYGSLVRGDSDRFSDRDVLLVSDDALALKEAKNLMSKDGFSCACYSWQKLGFLATRRALFVQHLKQESRIITDRDLRLTSLLASYAPACTYSKQIDAARDLMSLTECFPKTIYGVGWALDVLTVAFRNLSILTLANEGKYLFSFSAILSELRKMGTISLDHEDQLSSLRKYKASFRRKAYHLLPPKEKLFELKKIVGQVFDTDPHSTPVSEDFFHNYCLHSNLALKSSHWYLKARLYEGAFLTLNHRPRRFEEGTSSRLQAIEEAITNPGCYSALFLNSAENLRTEILDLAERELKAA